MTITNRLLLTFGLSFLIATVIGVIGYMSTSYNMEMTHQMVHMDAKFLTQAQALKIQALQHRRYEKDFFLNIGKPEKQKKYIKKFKAKSKSLQANLDQLKKLATGMSLTEGVFAVIEQAGTAYMNYFTRFMELTQKVWADDSITPQQANKMMTPFKKQIYAFEKKVDELLDVSRENVNIKGDEIARTGARLKTTIITCFIIGGLLISVLGLLTLLRIRSGLAAVSGQMEEIASGKGDLTRRITIKNKDEIGHLSGQFNQVLNTLQEMIKRIRENAVNLNQSSSSLSDVASTLSTEAAESSDKTQMIAAAAEEVNVTTSDTAAAMEQATTNVSTVASATEEMGATVGEIAKNAEKAKAATSDAFESAKEAAEAINELNDYSEKIGKVTEVITEISEKTNLLALNATIEAARAGESGKGFAVVAGEIKELALQTADATLDIKRQIEYVQVSTQKGVKTIHHVSSAVEDVNEMISSVAAASEEQSATTGEIAVNVAEISLGLGKVNESLGQNLSVIGEITRDISDVSLSVGQIASSTKEIDENSSELSQLAGELTSMVNRFQA